MRKSRFTTERIIGFLKQVEAGMPVAQLGRQHGFSPASFDAWRAKFGGVEAEGAKRLKALEAENIRMKRLLAEAHLDIQALEFGFGGITTSWSTMALALPALCSCWIRPHRSCGRIPPAQFAANHRIQTNPTVVPFNTGLFSNTSKSNRSAYRDAEPCSVSTTAKAAA